MTGGTFLRVSHLLAAAALPLIASVLGLACGRSSHDRAIIHVGRSSITESAVKHWMSIMAPPHAVPEPPSFAACIAHLEELSPFRKPQALLKSVCRTQYAVLRAAVLRLLIANQWLIGEAREERIPVTADQVSQRLREKYTSTHGELDVQELLRRGGQTLNDVRLETQAELAQIRLHRRLVEYAHAVSSSDLSRYYRDVLARFRSREEREYDMLGNLTLRDVSSVLEKVRHGASLAAMGFRELVERPDFKHVPQEKRIFFEAVFRARPHVLVGPIKINGVYFVFILTRVVPPKLHSFAEARTSIAKELGVKRRAHFVAMWRKKWIARTSCITPYIVQKCKQYAGPTGPEDPVEVN